MANSFQESSCVTAMDHWESASAHVEESLTAFLKSTLALNTYLPRSRLAAKDLVSRIDSKIVSLYNLFNEQLLQINNSLVRTRNNIAGSLYGIPDEILSQIFVHVVLEPEKQYRVGLVGPEEDISAFYRRFYSLMRVCSLWRKVGISHGFLWSLFPAFTSRSERIQQQTGQLSLQRTQDRKLHLISTIEARAQPPSWVMELMSQHGHRFSTINLTVDKHKYLRDILSPLLDFETQGSLTELSLRYTPSPYSVGRPNAHPPDSDYLTTDSSGEDTNNQLFRSLRVLRVRNVQIHWQHVSLTQLVELRIDSVMLGLDPDLYQFLSTLTSAPQLQQLQLNSILTRFPPEDAVIPENPPLLFPNLCTLGISDLSSDAMWYILVSITPGSHKTTLFLTEKSLHANASEDDSEPSIENLIEAIQDASIHTLLLMGGNPMMNRNWIDSDGLHKLLKAVPFLECLKIHGWDFGEPEWSAFSRPQNDDDDDDDDEDDEDDFPKLRQIEITQSYFDSVDTLEDSLSDHFIQKLVIGGYLPDFISRKYSTYQNSKWMGWKPLTNIDTISQRLKTQVPQFELVDPYYEPTEYSLGHWPLC